MPPTFAEQRAKLQAQKAAIQVRRDRENRRLAKLAAKDRQLDTQARLVWEAKVGAYAHAAGLRTMDDATLQDVLSKAGKLWEEPEVFALWLHADPRATASKERKSRQGVQQDEESGDA